MALGYGNKYFGSGGGGGGGVTAPVAVAEGGTGADQSAIAKGGLLVGTAAGTIGIKAVGADGQVLTASAAAAGGVAWAAAGAAAAGGADTQIQYNDAGALNGHAALTLAKASGAVGLTAPFTLTPGSDIVPLTVRASAAGGTANILQIQTALNAPLITVAHDGTMTGNLTGDVTGNADTATDGLSTASGTAPLTLTLAAKGLTGSVAEFTGDAGAGGAAGTVPAPAAGDATKFLRGDKTWAAGGGGVTNSAGANVVTKSDGTNLVASSITDDGTTLKLGNTGNAVVEATGAVTLTAQAVGTTPLTVKLASGQTAPGITVADSTGTTRTISLSDRTGDTNFAAYRRYPMLESNGKIVINAGNLQTIQFGSDQYVGFTIGPYGEVGSNSGGAIGFGSNSATAAWSTNDTFFRRRAAANPAWGAASATPVAYTHSLAADARAGTDTDVSGATATIQPGIGTGLGTSGDVVLSVAPKNTATGTTANTPQAVVTLAPTSTAITVPTPVATTGASQAGNGVAITASPAVASTDTAGAAAGGNATITAGAAARNTSGNAFGGNIFLRPGAGIGTGVTGVLTEQSSTPERTGIRVGPWAYGGLTVRTGGAAVSNFSIEEGGKAIAGSGGTFAFSAATTVSETTYTTTDTILRRRAAANPAWGLAAASPVAYTHSLAADSRAGTDTNTAGANATLAPGNGTGTGAASALIIQTPAVAASGTGAQTLTQRVSVKELHINLALGDIVVYANNAAALAGGLVAGDLYRTGADPDPVCIVH